MEYNNIINELKANNNYNILDIQQFMDIYFSDLESAEAKKEVDDIISAVNDEEGCSFFVDNIVTPSTLGLSFFQNSNLFISINLIIPDLFRKCFARDPVSFNKSSPIVCPSYSRMPLDIVTDMKYSYNFFFQKLIDENFIKGFLYFDFSSNPKNMTINDIPAFFLKFRYYNSVPSETIYQNQDNFYSVTQVFDQIYSKDSLLVQLLNLDKQLKESSKDGVNNTNLPPFRIPWISTYSCLSEESLPSNFIPYNNIFAEKDSNFKNSLEYSDLLYLNAARDNFQSISDQFSNFLEDITIGEIVKKNNIYTVIELAKEVYNEIIKELNSLLSDKSYNYPEYTNFLTLIECLNIYCNYVQNESKLLGLSSLDVSIENSLCSENAIFELIELIIKIIFNSRYNKNIHLTILEQIKNNPTTNSVIDIFKNISDIDAFINN